MAEVGKKRKAPRTLEEATKRMRVDALSTAGVPPTDWMNAIFEILISVYRGRPFKDLRGRV